MRLIDADELITKVTRLRDLAKKREEDTPVNSPCYRTYVAQANERQGFIGMINDAPTIEHSPVINMKPLTAEEKQGLINALKKSRLKIVKLDDEGIRGEWIVIHNALGETKYQCNRCQHYVKPSDDKNFCPNCGADMRKGEWIPNKGNGYSNHGRHCSLCGENVEFSEPVCPGCRARMKIGGDNA